MKSNEDNIFKIVDKLQEEFCCILANNCDSINDCLGISVEGDETLFLNQVGDWVEAGGGSSQWITTGSDIYYNTGNVGIGTNTPTYLLTVFGDMFLSGGTYVDGFLNILPSSGAVQIGDFAADVNGTSINLNDSTSTISYSAGSGHSFIGNVGIGTTPIVALDVVGDVKISGLLSISGLTNYADNAAALVGGLVVGDLYYTNVAGSGILKIVL
jgi:hypothetical protein